MEKGAKPDIGSSGAGSSGAEGFILSYLISSFVDLMVKKVDTERNQASWKNLSINQEKDLDQFKYRDYDGQRPRGRSSLVKVEEVKDKKCTCDDVTISVLYANLRSMNPKSETSSAIKKKLDFRALIKNFKPNIVAVVETWLMTQHKDNQVKKEWGLEDYKIFRFDRADNLYPGTTYKSQDSEWKGGGILVGYRNDYPEQFEFTPEKIEDKMTNSNDNLQGFAISRYFKCFKCTPEEILSYSFRVIYRRPSALKKQANEEYKVLDKSLMSLIKDYYHEGSGGFYKEEYTNGVMVGDFNMNNTSGQLIKAFIGHAKDLKLIDLKYPTTIKGSSPDAIFSTRDFVKTVRVLPFISDHAPLFFTLKLGKDVPPPPYQFCKACNA